MLIRLATASPGSQATTKQTVGQLEGIARQAAQNRSDILLLPEAYLGGYPRGSDFGCKVGARTADGREEYLAYFKQAVDLGDTVGEGGAGAGEAWVHRSLGGGGGETFRQQQQQQGEQSSLLGHGSTGTAPDRLRGDGTREELERIARETGVFVVVGLVEKAGGSLYCAVVYVCPHRGMIGKRRKIMPTGSERLIWAQGSPATLKAVSTVIRGVRINMAAAICWENYMPLLRQAIYAQNVNLYLAPTADNRDAWMSLMRTVSLEGRCFVVSSNMCVRDEGPEQRQRHGSNGVHMQHQQQQQQQQSVGNTSSAAARARRNSCFTEEGFEIALPPASSSPSSSSPTSTRPRRRSIMDEDGNEIVLCSQQQKQQHHKDQMAASAAAGGGDAVIEEIPEREVPSRPAKQEAATFTSRGGSSIVAPTGDVLAGPQWEDERGIIYADVDFDDCIRGRLDLDAAGSYSRNDSFRFSVQGLDLDPLPYY